MATNTNGNLVLDLVLRGGECRAGMNKVGRIDNQKIHVVEACAEKTGKVTGKSLDNLALIANSILD